MGNLDLLIIAIGVAMDAFAISICKGMAIDKIKIKHIIIVGIYFGGFQALMPIIGYFLGISFSSYVMAINHWVAFIILFILGLNMVMAKDRGERIGASFSIKVMLPFALATSIDSLAVGVTLATLKAQIISSILIIGIVTFIFSGLGLVIGHKFGAKLKNKAELIGGLILIFMAFEILLEYLNVL